MCGSSKISDGLEVPQNPREVCWWDGGMDWDDVQKLQVPFGVFSTAKTHVPPGPAEDAEEHHPITKASNRQATASNLVISHGLQPSHNAPPGPAEDQEEL